MAKNKILVNSSSNEIKIGSSLVKIEVDSSDKRIESITKPRIGFLLPDTGIFDNSFDLTFN